jgi:hypothetical protein
MMHPAPSAQRRRPLQGIRVVRLGLVLFGLGGCAESAITADDPDTEIEPSLGEEAGSDDGPSGAADAGGPAGGEDASPPWSPLDAGAPQADLDAGRGDADSADAGTRDAGTTADAGTRDAGAAADASTRDAGVRDAGSSPADAGAVTPDAGTRDAGAPADAGGGGSCKTENDCNNDCSVAGPIRCCSENRCGCSWFALAYCSI